MQQKLADSDHDTTHEDRGPARGTISSTQVLYFCYLAKDFQLPAYLLFKYEPVPEFEGVTLSATVSFIT